jgi:hypothetical protein
VKAGEQLNCVKGNRETYEIQVRDVLKVGEIFMKGKREKCERQERDM